MATTRSAPTPFYRAVMRRRWRTCLVVGLAAAVAGTVAVRMSPRRFVARSLVALRGVMQRRSLPLATQAGYEPSVVAEPLTGPTWVEWVNGFLFAEKVASRLRPEDPGITAFEANIRVRASLLGENLIKIEARDVDPERARRLATAAAHIFIEESLARLQEEMGGAVRSLEDRVRSQRAAIEEAYGEIAAYKRENGVGDPGAEREHWLDRLQVIEQNRTELEAKLVKTRALIASLSLDPEQPIPLEAYVARDQTLGSSRQQLQDLRAQLVEAESQYGTDHPKVQNLREAIESQTSFLEGRLRDLRSRTGLPPNPEYLLELQDFLVVDRAFAIEAPPQLEFWDRLYQRAESAYRALPQHEAELERLQVAADLARERYQTLVSRLDDLSTTRELVTGNAAIVDIAAPKESFPLTMRLAFVAGISLLLAIGAGFLHEALDVTVHDADDLERVLGVGPLVVLPRRRAFAKRPTEPGGGRPELEEPWRLLVVRLRFAARERPFRTLLVTSPNDGEGVSTVAARLAVTAAGFGERVVLVEGDLRRPCLAARFGLKDGPGLVQVLLEGAPLGSVLRRTGVQNLRILPAGRAVTNPVELVGSGRMRDVTADLLREADLVLYDTPSLLSHAETASLASSLDAALLVARASVVSRGDVVRARARLEETGVRVVGVVLNAVRRLSAKS